MRLHFDQIETNLFGVNEKLTDETLEYETELLINT